MLKIRSSADLARALDDPLDPDLRQLLTRRRDQLSAGEDVDLSTLVNFIVVRRGDRLSAVEAEVGFALAGELSAVEWAQRHPSGWIEAAAITDDDGFAVVVIARDCVCTDPDLLLALLAHA